MQLLAALLLPLANAPAPAPLAQLEDAHARGGVDWYVGTYEGALAAAQAEGKLVLIEFWADWCGWCKQHERTNLSDPDVLESMGDYVCFSADLSQDENGNIRDKAAEKLMNRFAIRRFPGLVFVAPDDRPEDLISGFLPTPKLLEQFARVRSGKDTRSNYERRVANAPEDLELKYQYAIKLDELGEVAGYQAQMDLIVTLDPESKSLPRQRMALGILREQLWGCMRDPELAPDPTELQSFLAATPYPEIQCNGWLLMGIVETELGRDEAAREAYRKAWKHVPADLRAPVGNGIAWGYWTQRDDLPPSEKQWALDVALQATAAFEEANTDPVAIAQYVDTLACCYYMNGKRAKAMELMKRCMELDPDEPGYRERFGQFKSRS